jgi:superfamily I DNA/RNA helicase
MKLWSLGNPVLETEFLMVDESQDTNGVLAGVIRKQTHLQRILVGDSQQRLFGWRGTVDMMKEFKDAEVRYLTQSFRFGQAVADEANLWLEYLDAPLRLRGLQSINSKLDFIEHPDVILCRTNADVIEQAMDSQARGMDVAVVGGTEEISSFAAGAAELMREGKTRHRELQMFKQWGDVLHYVKEEEPGGSFSTAVNLIQRYGAGQVQSIANRCVPPRDADLTISTVHKVKGMEWDKVMLDRNLAPDDARDQEDMGKGELMVAYVATTRARDVLDATSIQPFHQRRQRRKEAIQT